MKVFTEKVGMFFVVSLFLQSFVSAQVLTKVTDVTHSKNPFGEKIAFRFDKKPIINYLPSPDDYTMAEESIIYVEGAQETGDLYLKKDSKNATEGLKELVFFLPLTAVTHKKTKQFLNQLNVTQGLAYTMVVEPVETPLTGLKCTVAFNPKDVGFQVEAFVSPKGEHGIAFTYYLRDKLTTVLAKHDSIKQVAYVDAKPSKKKYV